MTPPVHPDPLNPATEECLRLHKCWPWFLILGIVLVIVGTLAVGAALFTTLASIVLFASFLLAGGAIQVVNAFLARSWRGFFLFLLGGILHLIVGGLMLEHPVKTAEALTLMLAAAFLVGGAFRVVAALSARFAGWGWVVLNGVVTFVLGVGIWRRWPESAEWVIGLCVGIDLIFNGWSWVMLGLMVKAHGPQSRASPERAAAGGSGRREVGIITRRSACRGA